MNNRRLLSDNKGSAFIMVLICFFFIGIIAAIVLSVTHSNLETIGTSKDASKNFYENEESIDELKNHIKEFAGEAMKEAYEEFLRNYEIEYANLAIDERELHFNNMFAGILKSKLKDYFPETGESENSKYKDLLYNTDNIDTIENATMEIVDGKLVIHDISIARKNTETGIASTITTDLEIGAKLPEIKLGIQSGIRADAADFILIADQTISNREGSKSTIRAVGNVYGGGKVGTDDYSGVGILATNGSVLEFFSDDIISRSTIQSADGSTIIAKGTKEYGVLQGQGDFYANIWAKDLSIAQVAETFPGISETKMDLKARCYISDDLSIDVNNANFKLQDGSEYYGYNAGSVNSDASESSSIVINGKNAHVDFSSADVLWLAGRNYVALPYKWGYTNDEIVARYMQGESISYKALQASYLIPGECIPAFGHNPISIDEINDYAAGTPYASKTPDEILTALVDGNIDINLSLEGTGINLTTFLDATKPFKRSMIIYGNGNNTNTMVYYYMNFSSMGSAARFFQEYAKYYADIVKGRAEMAGDNTVIKFNLDNADGTNPDITKSKIKTSGNILYYDTTEDKYNFYFANAEYSDFNTDNISKQYDYICQTLDPEMGGSTQDITKSVANPDKIVELGYSTFFKIYEDEQVATFKLDDSSSTDERDAYMIAAYGDVHISGNDVTFSGTVKNGIGKDAVTYDSSTIAEPVKAGIVLAYGDVYIDNSVDFWGTIIATGNIIINGKYDDNLPLHAATTYVRKHITTNPTIIPFFAGDGGNFADPNNFDALNFVSIDYLDWKKE